MRPCNDRFLFVEMHQQWLIHEYLLWVLFVYVMGRQLFVGQIHAVVFSIGLSWHRNHSKTFIRTSDFLYQNVFENISRIAAVWLNNSGLVCWTRIFLLYYSFLKDYIYIYVFICWEGRYHILILWDKLSFSPAATLPLFFFLVCLSRSL